MARCSICKKSAVSGNKVSHAQNRTKRLFKPNLQKVNGTLLCTKCLKTDKREEKVESDKLKAVEATSSKQ